MRKVLTILFLLFNFTALVAQEVRVKTLFPQTEKKYPETFDFIDYSFDLTGSHKIAIVKATLSHTGNETLADLFNALWKKANKLGANTFKIDSISNTSKSTALVMTLYHLNENELNHNFAHYPENMVYVLGDIDNSRNSHTIDLNDRPVTLQPMEYISYQNSTGEKTVVRINGTLGAKAVVYGVNGKLPAFLSINGMEIGPGSTNQLSISLQTGSVYPVDMNFGQFLILVLNEKQ